MLSHANAPMLVYDKGIHTSNHSSEFNASNDKLAVATPIDAGADKPIYEATDYAPNSNSRIYKSRRCMALTFVVLAVIAIVITVSVVYSTKSSMQPVILSP